MGYQQAFSAYKQTGVKTATQGKLIVMLYDEAVKQLGLALDKFNKDGKIEPVNIEKFGENITKTQEIITELMVSLNMNTTEGHDIAENLLSLYIFFNRELVDANMNLNKEKIASVHKMMSDLRDCWAEAETMTTTHASTLSPSISISG